MKSKNTIKDFSIITLGMFIVSAAVYFFLIPSNIVVGSISGLVYGIISAFRYSYFPDYFHFKFCIISNRIYFYRKGFRCKNHLHLYAAAGFPLDF